MAEIYQLPSENSGNAGMGNIPFSIPIGGFGMGNNGFGFGNGCGYPSSPTANGKDILKTELENADFEETKDDN